jgi:ribose-phosphate pyrophosphokinase
MAQNAGSGGKTSIFQAYYHPESGVMSIMIVIGGSSSPKLSASLANELGATLAKTDIKRFPDGEGYVRVLDQLDGQDVVLVSNTYPDEKMIETLLLCDAIEEFEYKRFTLVIPYFGYSRQDKQFNPGEPISARAMVRALEVYPDMVLTVDIHADSTIEWFETCDAKNVSGHLEIANKLKEIGVDFIVSPDEGRIKTAEKVSKGVGVPSDYLVKDRIDGNIVRIEPKHIDVSGKRVAIVDDIISTGGTIIKASNELKKLGAASVIAACTHGLFANNALDRLNMCCDNVISSDTLENQTTAFSVAPAIAREIT